MAKRGNNEGSITKRSNGTWRVQVSLGGKRLSFTANTKSECQLWLRKTLDQIDQGLTYRGTQTTLGEFLTGWIATVKTSLRPKTAHQYEEITQNYLMPGLGPIKLKDLRALAIDNLYQAQLKAGTGVRTVRYIHSVLHVALVKAVKMGLIGFNPADGATPPRLVTEEMQVLDETQVSQFLVAVQDNRNKALYHLAVKTGMRQAELLGLKWVDLNWTSGLLHIKRQVQRLEGKGFNFCEPKTKSGRRTIQLGETTLQVMREHLANQAVEKALAGTRWKEKDLIFPSSIGTPLDLRNLLRDYKELLDKAGLPALRFHDLRHTAASIMLKHNIPVFTVSKILGHSKPSITLDIYGHLIPGMQSEAARIMDDALTPVKIDLQKRVRDSETIAESNRGEKEL